MAMIKDDIVYRNLPEQVLKNKIDIENILTSQKVLGEFGIKIVGYVETVEELPSASSYTGEYGDAYAVGTETPYDYYIFTRPTNDIPEAHWFDIGKFPLEGPLGPQGPAGPQGPKGDNGLGIITVPYNPTSVLGYNLGQTWINTITADVYQLYGGNPNYWTRVANWKGPQGLQGERGLTGPQGPVGPQGPTGSQGPAGQSITIFGQVPNESSLPDPTLVRPGSAYLVGTDAPYELYAVVGASQNTQQWLNVGLYNDFTYIEITLPVNADQGTLSVEQLEELQSSPYNTIKCNNEYYRLNDDMTSNGYLVYSHTGRHTDKVYVKTFTITISTRGFIIDVLEVADAPLEIKKTLSTGWTDITGVEPFTCYQFVELAGYNITEDMNLALFVKGANVNGLQLANIEYSDGLGGYLAVVQAITKPTDPVDIMIITLGGDR